MERTVVAILKIDDSRAIEADMGTIDYLEDSLSSLTSAGIILNETRILDDDDPGDTDAIKLAKLILEEGI